MIARLAGFNAAMAAGWAATTRSPAVSVAKRKGGKAIELDHLDVALPDGAPLLEVRNVALPHGDRVLLTGPTGSGKSTLFRAIAGIWPFGAGTVTVPAEARMMALPQRPYLPIGPLHAAVSYPAAADAYDATRLAEALTAVGLPGLVARLSEEAHWNRMLSPGEQQRLAIARAILYAPDYLLLDEATAAIDEDGERALYRLLHERLPSTTIISIGHRETLEALHRRRFALERANGVTRMVAATPPPAS